MKKLAVVGSRNFNNYQILEKEITKILIDYKTINTIISGGAKGADSLGERFANENGLDTEIYLPNWKKYGKRAGFIRNKDIINNSDIVIAFWDMKSKGTKNSIDLTKKQNKKLIIVEFN